MLVMKRRKGQRLRIGEDVTLTVTHLTPSHVTFAIACPLTIRILREEAEQKAIAPPKEAKPCP